jgi:hypothetical protein
MTKDYSITLQDSTGRIAVIGINGTSIDELVAAGLSFDYAVEEVENNSAEVAIRNGEIGSDCHLAPANMYEVQAALGFEA